MNDYQEEKHNSNQLVVKVAKENPDVIRQIPDFEEGINKLDVINKEVEEIRPLQEQDNTGIAEHKGYSLQKLLNKTLDISGAVYSWANKKSDQALMERVNFKTGKLSKMMPGMLISAATTTLEEAKKVPAADLAKAGITAAELTAYEEMVTYFKGIANSPRAAIIETSVHTKRLKELFAESSALFRETLDRLARQFKDKAPDFYLKYRGARKAIRHTPVKPKAETAVK
jgi:hypothetical protein